MQKVKLLTVLLLLVSLLMSAFNPSLTHAQIGVISDRIKDIVVNQQNGDIWVFWRDRVTQYNVNGVQVKEVPLPLGAYGSGSYQRGIVFTAQGTRYYYFDFYPDSPSYKKPAYLDLNTGKVNPIEKAEGVNVPECRLSAFSNAIYNPLKNEVYLWCASKPENSDPRDTLIISANNKVSGWLENYQIWDYNAANQKLIAKYAYRLQPEGIPSTFPFVDVLALDSQTLKPDTAKPLLKQWGPYGDVRSINVNNKTGNTYITYSSCYAKCIPPYQSIIDKNLNEVSKGNTLVESYSLLNEATNQLYGMRLANQTRENIAVSGANPYDEQLAGFYWNTLAVDNTRNLVYAVDYRGQLSREQAGNGSGILVMDGNNFDIIRFITVKNSHPILSDYATPLSAPPTGFNGLFFRETGHTLKGRFLEFWQKNGGLAIFGFPVTEEFSEYNQDDGKTYIVQYFERNRFEYHPELEGTPFVVQLGLLGRNFSAQTGPAVKGFYQSGETEPIAGGVRFKETAKTLTGKFYQYWQSKGGLVIFGLPVTEPFYEVNPVDGKSYLVQYFERNRFELHPEFAGTEYEVLLGLLGKQVLWSRGWDIYR
jgi:hypothetical protein